MVALPAYGENYKVNDFPYEVCVHNRGNICQTVSSIDIIPGNDAICGEVKFVKQDK